MFDELGADVGRALAQLRQEALERRRQRQGRGCEAQAERRQGVILHEDRHADADFLGLAARVRELYDIDIRAYPSSLYFGWAYLAGVVGVPMDVAFSLFTALFSLLGPLLATLLLLSAFGRPLHLALLVLPVSYHHQVWFGFLGSSAAITGILLALAFARRVIDRPSVGNHLGLAGALLACSFGRAGRRVGRDRAGQQLLAHRLGRGRPPVAILGQGAPYDGLKSGADRQPRPARRQRSRICRRACRC